VQAHLAPAEGDRLVGGDGVRVDGAGVGVEARGEIDSQQARWQAARACVTKLIEHAGERALDGAGAAGTQEGVDH